MSVRFVVHQPKGDRFHHVCPEQIEVLLERLPEKLWSPLREVILNDRSRGCKVYGYVTMGLRSITLCAQPKRCSFTGGLYPHQTPEQFGAVRGKQWPRLAISRFMLYHVFLHELGHIQPRGGFLNERQAERFADHWRERLWSTPFEHFDPVHQPPQRTTADFPLS